MKENVQTSKRYQRGFEPGLSRLRVRHSTTEPPRSTRRMGTRAKPGNQLVYHICIHLLNPHWPLPRQAVISTQQGGRREEEGWRKGEEREEGWRRGGRRVKVGLRELEGRKLGQGRRE